MYFFIVLPFVFCVVFFFCYACSRECSRDQPEDQPAYSITNATIPQAPQQANGSSTEPQAAYSTEEQRKESILSQLIVQVIPENSIRSKPSISSTRSITENKMINTIREASMSSRFLRRILHNDKSCVICLEDYTSGEEIVKSHNEKCHHYFHKDCMIDWLMRNKHDECPLCRAKYLVPPPVADNITTLTPVEVEP